MPTLVLARRLHERILIPAAGTAIRVVGLTPSTARLGITAPPDVGVFREEICPAGLSHPGPAAPPAGRAGGHAVRNGLNNLSLGLALLDAELAAAPPAVRDTLRRVRAEYAALRDRLLPAAAGAAGAAAGR